MVKPSPPSPKNCSGACGPWKLPRRLLTQTLNLTFLYDTVSTLKPTVGMVVTDCPSFSR